MLNYLLFNHKPSIITTSVCTILEAHPIRTHGWSAYDSLTLVILVVWKMVQNQSFACFRHTVTQIDSFKSPYISKLSKLYKGHMISSTGISHHVNVTISLYKQSSNSDPPFCLTGPSSQNQNISSPKMAMQHFSYSWDTTDYTDCYATLLVERLCLSG